MQHWIRVAEFTSIPDAYQALDEITQKGFEALEFYPYATGVRIVFKANAEADTHGKSIAVSENILKALLSQTDNKLKEKLVVVESTSFFQLLELANEFDQAQGTVLEIRSLRSNAAKNYALITCDNEAICPDSLKKFDYKILKTDNVAFKEFFSFL